MDEKRARQLPKRSPKSISSVNVSDDAVRAATGKTWRAWFALLDDANATKLTHKEIVALLSKRRGLSPWWQQNITVAYEKTRGLRVTHERPGGFSISRSKTLPVPVSALYKSWADGRARAKWLALAGLVIRKATPEKSIRMTWTDGTTSVEVNFYDKGEKKSQVVVQHDKLPDRDAAEKMKAFWGDALEALAARLKR